MESLSSPSGPIINVSKQRILVHGRKGKLEFHASSGRKRVDAHAAPVALPTYQRPSAGRPSSGENQGTNNALLDSDDSLRPVPELPPCPKDSVSRTKSTLRPKGNCVRRKDSPRPRDCHGLRRKEVRSRRERAIHSFLFPESTKSRRRQRKAFDLLRGHPLLEVYNIFKGDSVAQLKLGNLERLDTGKWLHGDAVDWAVFSMAGAALKGERTRTTVVYPTQFVQLLDRYGLQSDVIRQCHWTREEREAEQGRPLFTYEDILVPLNLDNNHWYLVRSNLAERVLELYDSLSPVLTEGRRSACRKIIDYLVSKEAWETGEKQEVLRQEWSVEVVRGLPRQENSFDCGVYTCAYAQALLTGADPTLVTQEYVSYLRARLLVLSIELSLKF